MRVKNPLPNINHVKKLLQKEKETTNFQSLSLDILHMGKNKTSGTIYFSFDIATPYTQTKSMGISQQNIDDIAVNKDESIDNSTTNIKIQFENLSKPTRKAIARIEKQCSASSADISTKAQAIYDLVMQDLDKQIQKPPKTKAQRHSQNKPNDGGNADNNADSKCIPILTHSGLEVVGTTLASALGVLMN